MGLEWGVSIGGGKWMRLEHGCVGSEASRLGVKLVGVDGGGDG